MRNKGWGTRSLRGIGEIELKRAVARKEISFSSRATHFEHWVKFCDYCKSKGIGRLENITSESLIDYGRTLAEQSQQKQLSVAYAQNCVSSVNTIMRLIIGTQWKRISPTKDCGIGHRSFVRTTPPPTNELIWEAIAALWNRPREKALVWLCFAFGLRSKEASLLNIRQAIKEAEKEQQITVIKGTKGGRKRIVRITNANQIEALKFALSSIENSDLCLVPKHKTYKQWREGDMRHAREIVKTVAQTTGLHALRAAYACNRYQALSSFEAPVIKGKRSAPKLLDISTRQEITEELGHSRLSVTNAYLGSSK